VKRARDAMKNLLLGEKGSVKSAFRATLESIGKLWDKVKGIISKPLKAVIGLVNNHFIGHAGKKRGLNFLLSKLGVEEKNRIPWIDDRGFARGGYTGPGPKFKPAGIVHADEFVMRKEARRRLERVSPGALDYMNKTGRWPRYANGGRVWPVGTRAQSGNYAGHSGIDFPISYRPVYAADDGRISYTGTGRGYGIAIFERFANGLEGVYGHMSLVLVKAGQVVRAGQQIAVSGYTWRSTGPHVHFEVNGAGAFG